jgi:hypothetical protein
MRRPAKLAEVADAQSGKLADVAAQDHQQRRRSGQPGRGIRRRGAIVQRQSNDKLVAHLQRVEGALTKSMARSDEQLAYYVAQAAK